jgi:Tol biopolymer transport system component
MFNITAKTIRISIRLSAALLLIDAVAIEAVSAQNAPAPFEFVSFDPSATAIWPVFSPDGSRLIFSQRPADGPFQLFVIPASGGTARRLFDPPLPIRQNQADWKRVDGAAGRIAFAGGAPGKRPTLWVASIITAQASSAREVVVREIVDGVYYPAWHPKRDVIIIVSSPDNLEDLGGVLREVDLGTGAVKTLTDRAQILAGRPDVSPDGTAIAFAGQTNVGQQYDQKKNKIWILDSNHKLRQLEQGQGRSPAWSPDGRHIAFESDRGNEAGLYAIYVVESSGGIPVRLTPFEIDAHHPTWSPDGRRIAFDARLPRAQWGRGIAILDVPTRR